MLLRSEFSRKNSEIMGAGRYAEKTGKAGRYDVCNKNMEGSSIQVRKGQKRKGEPTQEKKARVRRQDFQECAVIATYWGHIVRVIKKQERKPTCLKAEEGCPHNWSGRILRATREVDSVSRLEGGIRGSGSAILEAVTGSFSERKITALRGRGRKLAILTLAVRELPSAERALVMQEALLSYLVRQMDLWKFEKDHNTWVIQIAEFLDNTAQSRLSASTGQGRNPVASSVILEICEECEAQMADTVIQGTQFADIHAPEFVTSLDNTKQPTLLMRTTSNVKVPEGLSVQQAELILQIAAKQVSRNDLPSEEYAKLNKERSRVLGQEVPRLTAMSDSEFEFDFSDDGNDDWINKLDVNEN